MAFSITKKSHRYDIKFSHLVLCQFNDAETFVCIVCFFFLLIWSMEKYAANSNLTTIDEPKQWKVIFVEQRIGIFYRIWIENVFFFLAAASVITSIPLSRNLNWAQSKFKSIWNIIIEHSSTHTRFWFKLPPHKWK